MAISLLLSQYLAQLPQQWLLLLLLPLVLSFLLVARSSADQKGLKLPPSPPRLPVLGNLHQLSPLPHQSLRDLARRHGPVISLRLGMIPAVAVSSAAAARDVLRAHDPECCNRPASPGNRQLSYGFKTVAFSPYGAYWRHMRRLFAAELLGARRVRAAWAARREQVQKLMRSLSSAAARSAPIALDEHVYGAADGIIGMVAYGNMYGAATFAGKYGRFQHVLDEAMDVTAGFAAEDFFPNAAGRLADRLTGILARRKRVFKDLDTFFEAVIEQRTDPKPEDEDNGVGLVDALIGLWKQGEHAAVQDRGIVRVRAWGDRVRGHASIEGSEVDFRGAHFELLPFGAGRRICPGLAMGVANMLCGFDWALPEGVEEVSMEEAGRLTIHRKTPLVLVPTVYRYRPERGN